MDISSVIDSLHPLETKVLATFGLQANGVLSTEQLTQATGLEPSQLSMAVEWLLAKGLLTVESEHTTPVVSLTKIGELYFEKYSPIERVLSAARDAAKTGRRLTIRDIQSREGLEPADVSGAIGRLKKEGALLIIQGGCIEATGRPSATAEAIRAVLLQLRGTSRELQAFPELYRQVIQDHAVKRGNAREPFRIDERGTRSFKLSPSGVETTRQLSRQEMAEEVSQLSPELLKDGSWRTKRFRKYTISLRAPRMAPGKRHPYREFLDAVKTKLVSMGFQEMRGSLVETEFWNMDALFMPQFHPARDIHDVYFVKEPKLANAIAEPFLSRVAQTHQDGGDTGSAGWGYRFDLKQARRLMLRSQGTAVSAHTLASRPSIPGKYFSIARCFRYDQVDATHATDFFQVEGIVLGEDINFRTLLGLLNLFAREVAQAREVKFLPAYFPFTEPSVEMHVRHPRLGWMELGGAGLFRQEVTLPLGVKVPVIAWGLGLDRMAMVALGIHDIRELFTDNLELIRSMRGSV
ncbi:MAG TPA: phenylalanine--tRNA ligase subunit alpha [Nitrospiraceae bacterium]|nr:phenylalanine--tRNA ligase subunit alpha [Nitrospiraceae bacterium]